ncbi:MAG: acetoacetate--CoA ligase [Actinomycetota bacterium]|nr:acetoacetate--CoA ligase [Actinomycetota bacterium]
MADDTETDPAAVTATTAGATAEWAPEVLWSPARPEDSAMARFATWAVDERGAPLPEPLDYEALHDWSVQDLDGFWSAAAEFCGVHFATPPTATVRLDDGGDLGGTTWFPGATLNYAEHALFPAIGGAADDVAVLALGEDGRREEVTYGRLRELVARARAGLVRAGLRRGDRVAAFAPNTTETLVALLATTSLGAIWSSCSPDFGARAAADRFAQIRPTVLFAARGYRYGGRHFDIRASIAELRDRLPDVDLTVLLADEAAQDEAAPDEPLDAAATISWAELTAEAGPLAFDPVPFEHPLWILYSSGTTGLPKGIVHSHGGIVVEHLKTLRLHFDLGPGSRFLWFTTTGWMMWNLLVSGLTTGATVVLYDGNPGHPDLSTLWRLVDEHRITYFGISAPFVRACAKAGIEPARVADLSSLRAVGSTGAPLSPDGFRWLADQVGGHVPICSLSGGTDVCSGFLGAAPLVPVWVGELSCASLGASVHAFDQAGRDLVGEVGELVLTRPMPSMPVALWGDDDGSRLREAYFEHYPGRWRHGDWVVRTPRDSFVIHGRSDATLNRGGVRMGTADFYAVVEDLDEVADSLVVDTTALGADDEGALLLFVVLVPGATLAEVEPRLRSTLRRELSPRHVPDRIHAVAEVPRTLNGKKCEVPVKRILAGVPADQAVSTGALANPAALDPFRALVPDP